VTQARLQRVKAARAERGVSLLQRVEITVRDGEVVLDVAAHVGQERLHLRRGCLRDELRVEELQRILVQPSDGLLWLASSVSWLLNDPFSFNSNGVGPSNEPSSADLNHLRPSKCYFSDDSVREWPFDGHFSFNLNRSWQLGATARSN